ncbi:MAG: glucosylceramidase [Bacteroidales bacterium]|jgi:glucosylceramidase|nr:glucosylceramidase [Bacteroidales bacterium]MDX9926740.1 glycoside hydrolase family 30 beta sandwich domain-containing protein [Bacteroidales bacterium]HNX83085.1 glycoside hydrolase family 30 beta sandwich domain-containing protein [Bacteroidales bacterium]HOC47830.1 glycoside hydrolase family 30 beta sandwich domain-containing protein [Bacteroidales bacterium]HPS96731.1 glycoside hydrolase family 30 beta sandwich domain-containing protein [Bacteroidales bacterium]
MKRLFVLIISILLVSCNRPPENGPGRDDGTGIMAEGWITSPQKGVLFTKHSGELEFMTTANTDPAIVVDTTQRYQEIDGFGNCLTGGSAILLNKMRLAERTVLLRELFSPDGNGIGLSYLRITIGASDLSDRVFTYCDLPPGETDPQMEQFSIEPEKADLIPVLKEILAINPSLKILGSPWTAPLWMKTNNASVGGSLKHEWFDAYAKYFVKYIQAMKDEGIVIDAITVQNEPLHGGNNPSMVMTAADQALFIRQSLGPAFAAAGIKTKIIIYDHNADRTDYPLAVLNDAGARQYIDGSAFHLYGGSIDALTAVHDAFPAKNLYFTEQWVGGPGNLAEDLKWHVENLIIGATRNWCRNVIEWNLASDPSYDPHTEGGCDRCLGTVTLSGNNVTRNPAYYILAHASRHVRPGSVRVSTNTLGNLPNVAFQTPGGSKVLIVVNTTPDKRSFNVKFRGNTLPLSLDGGAVGTWIW